MLIWRDMKRITFLIQWGPAVLAMLVIFILSATPSYDLPDFGGADTLVKKGAHMLGYALLTLAFLRGVMGFSGNRQITWKHACLALILSFLYAMTDEYHQSFVPGRHSRWTDVGIDTIGGSVGLALWSLVPIIRHLTSFRLVSASDSGSQEYDSEI